MRRILTLVVTVIALCLALASTSIQYSAGSLKQQNAPQKELDANVLFEKHCDTCHGKDGRAKTFKAKFNHARNLTDAKWQTEVNDERIFNSIMNGKGKMPAWGKKLSEAQINALVAYVRMLKK
ncbi:MAG TPA: cytochrome c [Pyrinomonadaceae bacterium]